MFISYWYMHLTELNFKDISLIRGHTQIHKSNVLVLLSDLEYHRILEVKETCRDHLIQFNTGGCSAIFLVSWSSCIGCTTAKASKQIYFHVYPFAIQSPPAASRTSQQVNQIMLLPVCEGFCLLSSSAHTTVSGSLQTRSLPHKGTCLFLNPGSLCLILPLSIKLSEFIPPHSLLPWPGPS